MQLQLRFSPIACSIATFSLLKCVQNFLRRHLPSSHFFHLPTPRHAPNEIMRTYKQMNELIKNITDTEFGTCSIAHPQSSSTYSTYSSVQLAFWNSIYFHLKDHFLLRYIHIAQSLPLIKGFLLGHALQLCTTSRILLYFYLLLQAFTILITLLIFGTG